MWSRRVFDSDGMGEKVKASENVRVCGAEQCFFLSRDPAGSGEQYFKTTRNVSAKSCSGQ